MRKKKKWHLKFGKGKRNAKVDSIAHFSIIFATIVGILLNDPN